MKQICKNYEKCPIYNGILVDKVITAKGYRSRYCEAGESGWTSCKRYQVKDRTGVCPPGLLPNSFKDLETIIAEMNLK